MKKRSNDEELYFLIVELYEQFYRKVNSNPKYRFKVTERNQNIIINFISYIKKIMPNDVIGEIFIREFLNYSFGLNKDKGRKIFNAKVTPFNWIVSKKVLLRYVNSSREEKFVVKEKVNKTNTSVRITSTKKNIEQRKTSSNLLLTELEHFEELEKQRFKDEPSMQYLWCADMTTLFKPNSSHCVNCKLKVKCIKRLKKNYPQIYAIRDIKPEEESRESF